MEQIKNRFTGEIMCGGLSLKIVLEKHKKWLANEDGGEKADLRYADLRYADLRYANLSYANLRYADLRYADLRYADLRYANLSYADLRYAKNAIIPVSFGPVGEESRIGYAIFDNEKIMVRLGCFYGTEKDAVKAVTDKYGAKSGYVMMIKAACKIVKERGILNPIEEGTGHE